MVAAPPSLTAAGRLAEFCAGLRWGELDGEVQARTRELLLDLIGVALAGSRQASSPPAARVALDLGGQGAATVIGTRQTTSAVWRRWPTALPPTRSSWTTSRPSRRST